MGSLVRGAVLMMVAEAKGTILDFYLDLGQVLLEGLSDAWLRIDARVRRALCWNPCGYPAVNFLGLTTAGATPIAG